MSQSRHAVQWAENFIRAQQSSSLELNDHWVDEFLANELQTTQAMPSISEATMCAVEICKGGRPVDSLNTEKLRNQDAIESLDRIILDSWRFDQETLPTSLNVEKVKEIEQSDLSPPINAYASQILKTGMLVKEIQRICNNDRLAGAILRILAIRKSRRLQLIHLELQSLSGEKLDRRLRKRMNVEIAKLTEIRNHHIQSFLDHLDVEPPVLPAVFPPSAPNNQVDYGWFINVILVVIFLGFILFLSQLGERKQVKEKNPLSNLKAIEDASDNAAFKRYVDKRELDHRLWSCIRALKKGIASNDENDFIAGRRILEASNVKPEAFDGYSELRESAMIRLRIKPMTSTELESVMRPEWSVWFDSLPTCEDLDDRFKDLSTIQKVVQVEIEVANKWKEANKGLIEVIERLKEVREGKKKDNSRD